MTGLPAPPLADTRSAPLWRVVADSIRAAPPSKRRGLAMSPFPIAVAVVVSWIDIATGTDAQEVQRLLALVLASAGYTLLLVAHVLHYLSQQQSLDCANPRQWPFRAIQSHVPAQIFQALPAMALVSAALSTTAMGLYVPAILQKPAAAIMLPFFIWIAWLGFRAAAHTGQFLYTYAEQQASLAARAQAEASEARLAALQAQMNPHFLFNALNTVAALVRTNPRAAESTVEALADVLRRTLARSSKATGTVADEVEYLKAYLEVEQQRYGSRLGVVWDLAEDALGCELPPLMLQPLVENALRHGIGGRLEGGSLVITAERGDGRLRLSVTDNGAGLPTRIVEGTGLGNTRRRLATLFGEGASLTLEAGPAGTVARLDLPARE